MPEQTLDTAVIAPVRTSPAEPAAEKIAILRPRLEFLDGVRGLAALYVVLGHCGLEARWHGREAGLSRPLHLLIDVLSHGRVAVSVFIVLSGYCLMLPIARSRDGAVCGGSGDGRV